MKQYILPTIAGILVLSANIVVASPKGKSQAPPQKVESKGHSKAPEKSYGKAQSNAQKQNHWNDRIEVRAQKRLQMLGYYNGRIDGDFGRGSRAALVKFQRGKRIKATGTLDKMTIRALGI